MGDDLGTLQDPKERKGKMTTNPTYILHNPLVREYNFPIFQLVLSKVDLWYGDIGTFSDRLDGIGRLGRRGWCCT